MFKPDNRLAKVRDFSLVMKYGRWTNGQFLDVKVLELTSARGGSASGGKAPTFFFPKKEDQDNFKKQLRIAITVGLKVSKSAVKRNRARRQVSEAARLLIKDGLLKSGYYLLFVAKRDILTKNYAEISAEVILLLNKGKVLNTSV